MIDVPADNYQPSSAAPPSGKADRLAAMYPNDVPSAADEPNPLVERRDEAESQKSDEQASPAYDLRMPDGVPLDRDLLGEATPVLRDLGLTNDQATKLVPLALKVQERMSQQQEDGFSALKRDWAAATKADPNIGGARWPETERLISIALDAGGAGGGSEVRELLDDSGLGNHPAMVKFFRQIGYRLARSKSSGRSRLEQQYPNDKPQSGGGLRLSSGMAS